MLIIIMLHSILLLCVVHVTAVRCWQRPSQAMVGDRRGYAGSHTPRRTIGKSTSESLHKSGAYSMYCSVVTDFSTSNSVVFFSVVVYLGSAPTYNTTAEAVRNRYANSKRICVRTRCIYTRSTSYVNCAVPYLPCTAII